MLDAAKGPALVPPLACWGAVELEKERRLDLKGGLGVAVHGVNGQTIEDLHAGNLEGGG